jgi:hypothetical protein
MKEIRTWIWILLFGSLWGINEVVTGESLFRNQTFLTSIWLAAGAFFILGVARGVVNRPGTSVVIAGIAAGFKLVNASPYFCHLLGIFLLGVAFDATASLLLKGREKAALRHSLVGVLSAYSGFALFALIITYIIRYEYWLIGGSAKVINHVFVSGSLAATVAAFLVPLGYRLGLVGWPALEKYPRWSFAGAAAGLILLWTLGRIMG